MIISTLCYLIKDDQYLMLLRNKKKNDVNKGKWIGVGGKVEQGETIRDCMHREIAEETGFNADQLVYRGILNFYYENMEPEKIYVYTCDHFHGELRSCDEGTLAWIPRNKVLALDLWDGDRIFLKPMIEENLQLFNLKLVYDRNNRLIESEFLEIEGEE